MQMPEITPELGEAIRSLWDEVRKEFPESKLERVRGFLEILRGESTHLITRAPGQDLAAPNLFFPGLTARPWWEPEAIPWIRQLEAAHDAIREEYLGLKTQEIGAYETGYVSAGEAADSTVRPEGWKAFYFQSAFRPLAKNRARCPRTAAVLGSVPAAREALFSILDPGTGIPPHVDDLNFVITVHLGLVIPPDCSITVGGKTGTWREGRCIVIDTSFEHEAYNRSSERRAVLLIDTWHPDLTPVELQAIEWLRPMLEQALGAAPRED
jgi:aspartate beta-hydroxylase